MTVSVGVHPGYLDFWWDEGVDVDEWFVGEIDKVEQPIHVCRILLGEADPVALAEFDGLYDEGFREYDPPNWTGDRLRAFSDAAGRLPDPLGPLEGYWELTDDTVAELAPKLPWSKRLEDSSIAIRRLSIQFEWADARRLYLFLAAAVAAGHEVAVDS